MTEDEAADPSDRSDSAPSADAPDHTAPPEESPSPQSMWAPPAAPPPQPPPPPPFEAYWQAQAPTPLPPPSQASDWPPPQPHELDPLLVTLPERARQRRWTVLLRVFLAIPLAVVVLLVALAALACAIVGWFAALFTGRVPAFVRETVSTFVRMNLRLHAYLFLLTDRFPPFATEDVPEYPARIAVPPATTLHRGLVFCRIVLVFPVYVLSAVVEEGLLVFAFFMWFVVLVTGWLPKPVHDAYRAYLRYQARIIAYFYLVVPTYPMGLFGDKPSRVPVLAPVGDVSGQYASALALDPGSQPWSLVLGKGAKWVLALAIVVGVPVFVTGRLLPFSNQPSPAQQSHDQQVQVNEQLVTSFNQFDTKLNHCGTVSCLEHANLALSQELGTFVSALQTSNHAGMNQDVVDKVVAAAQSAQQATAAVSGAGSTLADYRSTVTRVHANQSLQAFITAQNRYASALNGS